MSIAQARTPGRLVALLLVAAGAAACGGPGAATSSPTANRTIFQKNRDSNYGQIGDVRLLHVHLATPPALGWRPGDAVPLHLTLANDGAQESTLVSVSTPAAAHITHHTPAGDVDTITIRVEPGATAGLQETDADQLVLVGFVDRVFSGLTVPITFELDSGESVTLAVPAQISSVPATRTGS